MHCLLLPLTGFFMFALTSIAAAQSTAATSDSTLTLPDTLALKSDTTSLTLDDSTRTATLEDSLGIRISKDALTSVVSAEATDSALLNMKENLFFLYGDAHRPVQGKAA